MDQTPFFEFNLLDFKESDVEEIKKFAKSAYDLDNILNTANQLKYVRAIQTKFSALIAEPSDELIRLLTADVIGNKRFTAAIKDQFSILVRSALDQFISERINARLKGAMTPLQTGSSADPKTSNDPSTSEIQQLSTSAEELEGYHNVKAILREIVDPKRIHIRDAQSYCAILLDDNNRKPICRLDFNNPNRLRIRLFKENKEQVVFELSSVDDIFNFADQLKDCVKTHL